MRFDPDRHHRRSIRLPGHDYRQAGAYFVTICAWQRECLFGDIVDGTMRLSEAGQIVRHTWENLPARFPSVALDEYIIMPNHVHSIIHISTAEPASPTSHPVGAGQAPPSWGAARPPALADIVGAFKSISAIEVNRLLARTGLPLWQRSYYDRIVRDQHELDQIRDYIAANPMRWDEDEHNPAWKAGSAPPSHLDRP